MIFGNLECSEFALGHKNTHLLQFGKLHSEREASSRTNHNKSNGSVCIMAIKFLFAFAIFLSCHIHGCRSRSSKFSVIDQREGGGEELLYTHASYRGGNGTKALTTKMASDFSMTKSAAVTRDGDRTTERSKTKDISARVKKGANISVHVRTRYGTNTHESGHRQRDKFECGRCMCTKNNHRLVNANCTFRNFTDLADTFPVETIGVNISHNQLTAVNQLHITSMDLKSLQTLDMSYNIIQAFIIGEGKTRTLKRLDLSHNRIKEIKDGSLDFAPMLDFLNLHYNKINRISNNTFRILSKLKSLDLSKNQITSIDGSAFDSLVNLRELYLYSNTHLGYGKKRFPPALFTNLKKLRKLWVQGNWESGGYPINSLSKLRFLEDLNIDIIKSEVFLGPAILNLTRLTTIAFGPNGHCYHLNKIPSTFFKYTPRITTLSFTRCLFHGIDPVMFESLPRLTSFSLRNMKTYGLEQAFQDIGGLSNKTMLKHLRLERLVGVDKPCLSLNGNHAKFLSHLPLIDLDLSNNRIALVRDDFIKALPPTLEKLVLRKNVLTTKDHLLYRLKPLVNLKLLDVSIQNEWEFSNTNERNKMNAFIAYSARTRRAIRDENHDKYWIATSAHTGNGANKSIKKMFNNVNDSRPDKYQLSLPKNLTIVMASYFNSFGSGIFNRKLEVSSLKKIDLSNSLLTGCGSGRMPLSIQHADMSGTFCRHLDISFFEPNNSLKFLSLKTNFLGPQFADSLMRHFSQLSELRFLDLSMNAIYRLPYFFLEGLRYLETLGVTDNRLQHFSPSLKWTPNLKLLDLRRNAISRISKQVRDELDELASKGPVTLALLHNPISCTCGNIDMIKWLSVTNVHLLDRELLQCLNAHGEIQVMKDLTLLHAHLQNKCTDITNIIIASTLCVGLFLLTLTGYYIDKRYRWWFYVKYKKNVWVAKWFGFKPKFSKEETEGTYSYDAYLLYCDADRELAIHCVNKLHSHRLFVSDRDILFGTSEISGMTSGITNSYKIIIVLSENFKEEIRTNFKDSGMLEYTINMALCEEISTKRKFLHVILFSNLDNFKMPLYLAEVLQDQKRQTVFPGEDPYASQEAEECVWDSLSTCIRQGSAPQREDVSQDVNEGDRRSLL